MGHCEEETFLGIGFKGHVMRCVGRSCKEDTWRWNEELMEAISRKENALN